MKKTYTASILAEYIVSFCKEINQPVTNLQLQDILYHIQKRTLANSNRPAFYDDFEAWQTGPVVPNIYYKYCGYGIMPITPYHTRTTDTILTTTDTSFINSIIQERIVLKPWDIVKEYQNPNNAWVKIIHKKKNYKEIIPISLIQNNQ